MPEASEYKLEFTSKGQIDLFTIKSCHQYQVIEPDSIIKRKSIKYTYRPNEFEKDVLICPLVFHAYEKDKGRHSFGMIDFKNNRYQGSAVIDCNGITYKVTGSAICQSEDSLYQRITFDRPSVFKSECSNCIAKEGNAYRIKLPKGLCLTTFMVEGKFFRLTTYGFEKVLIY